METVKEGLNKITAFQIFVGELRFEKKQGTDVKFKGEEYEEK